MPTVSVIIPNYNHANFLEERIRSIVEQTFQDFEVIILDDCSTDNSKSIIEKYRDHPKVKKIIYNEINSGSPFKQWNKGVESTSGEIIWLAESDDLADVHFLETLVPKFQENTRLGIAYCQSYKLNEKNEIRGTWLKETDRLNKEKFRNDFEMSGVKYIDKYLINFNTIPNASGVLFRKKYYNEIGGTNESIKYCSDWLTWIKILLISDIAFISKPLNFFRFHDQSVIAEAKKMFKEDVYYEVFDEIMRRDLDHYLEDNFKGNVSYDHLLKKNKKKITDIIGREGVFEVVNKRNLNGFKKIFEASLNGLTIKFFLLLLKKLVKAIFRVR